MTSCDGHQMRPERRGLVQLPDYTNREYCVAADITLSACTERKKFYVTVTPRSHLRHTARTSEMFDSNRCTVEGAFGMRQTCCRLSKRRMERQ